MQQACLSTFCNPSSRAAGSPVKKCSCTDWNAGAGAIHKHLPAGNTRRDQQYQHVRRPLYHVKASIVAWCHTAAAPWYKTTSLKCTAELQSENEAAAVHREVHTVWYAVVPCALLAFCADVAADSNIWRSANCKP